MDIIGPELFLDGSSFNFPGTSDFSYPWMVLPKKQKAPDDDEEDGTGGI